MRNQLTMIGIVVLAGLLNPVGGQAQKNSSNVVDSGAEKAKARDGKTDAGEFISGLFSQSDLFSPRSSFIWGDYQLLSTRGKRPDQTGVIIPPVGLNFERQLFFNLGARLSLSTNWWEEDKALVIAGSERFTELFEYRYWTGSLGVTWHFTIMSDWEARWDPYIGAALDYRHISATCDCSTETVKFLSKSAFIGTRYFLFPRFYLSGEFGRLGTGYFKFGLGFKIH